MGWLPGRETQSGRSRRQKSILPPVTANGAALTTKECDSLEWPFMVSQERGQTWDERRDETF